MSDLRKAYAADPRFAQLPKGFDTVDGIYYHDERIAVPDDPALKYRIIDECHSSLFAGHLGRDKTLESVSRLFEWPGMSDDVRSHVRHCHHCQTCKKQATENIGQLRLLQPSERPWWSVSMDFITGLPKTVRGHNAILVFVDRLTKMVHLVPCGKKCDAQEFARYFQDTVIARHGIPGEVVSDRDSRFTSQYWRTVCETLQLQQSMSSAFHPQSDGQTERVNRTLEQVLRAHCQVRQSVAWAWDDTLSMVEFALNNAQHSSTKYTPFMLNAGQHPITPIMMETLKAGTIPAAFKFTDDIRTVLRQARENILAARDRMKAYADAGRSERVLAVGQQVLLSTKNLKPKFGKKKLMPSQLGPFTVLRQINDVAYKIDVPKHWNLHTVFHVSLLHPYHITER
jgi:hypothetical protein